MRQWPIHKPLVAHSLRNTVLYHDSTEKVSNSKHQSWHNVDWAMIMTFLMNIFHKLVVFLWDIDAAAQFIVPKLFLIFHWLLKLIRNFFSLNWLIIVLDVIKLTMALNRIAAMMQMVVGPYGGLFSIVISYILVQRSLTWFYCRPLKAVTLFCKSVFSLKMIASRSTRWKCKIIILKYGFSRNSILLL